MPRLPPVTRTTWSAKLSGMIGLEQGVHAGQVLDIVDHRAGENLLDQPGDRPPRTNLNVVVRAQLLQALDRLRPAHRAGQLANPKAADLHRVRLTTRFGICDL